MLTSSRDINQVKALIEFDMTIREINSGSGNEAATGTPTDGVRYASESTEMESAPALDISLSLHCHQSIQSTTQVLTQQYRLLE